MSVFSFVYLLVTQGLFICGRCLIRGVMGGVVLLLIIVLRLYNYGRGIRDARASRGSDVTRFFEGFCINYGSCCTREIGISSSGNGTCYRTLRSSFMSFLGGFYYSSVITSIGEVGFSVCKYSVSALGSDVFNSLCIRGVGCSGGICVIRLRASSLRVREPCALAGRNKGVGVSTVNGHGLPVMFYGSAL